MNILSLFLLYYVIKSFHFESLLILRLDRFLCSEKVKPTPEVNKDDNHLCDKREFTYKAFMLASSANYLINFLIVLLIAHPQINNRVLATCPILYFYCADQVFLFCKNKPSYGLFIITFFFVFSILGCIMHTGSYGFA